jgi:hypothetical protein
MEVDRLLELMAVAFPITGTVTACIFWKYRKLIFPTSRRCSPRSDHRATPNKGGNVAVGLAAIPSGSPNRKCATSKE